MKAFPRILLLLLYLVVAALVLPVAAQEKSVKPGVNNHYDEVSVEKKVKQFEDKNRDVVQKLDAIIAACELKPGMMVADVGAGTGLFTRPFAAKVEPGGKVYAVDITKKFLDYIEKTCKQRNIRNVACVPCTPTSTTLPPESVDLVFTCDTYHHLEYPYKVLDSIHKALRAGGRLIIIDFMKKEGVSPKWVLDHVRADKKAVIEEVTKAGFKYVDELDLMKQQHMVRFEKVK